MTRLRQWLDETHSTGFELRRHFFLRFFDSDFVTTPGQWQVVAGGVLAVLLSLSLIFAQAYYHKYLGLNSLPTPEPQRLATMADVLFLITLSMFLVALFSTFLWPQLFPGLRDYLALASLPLRMRDVFVAKFSALVGFAALIILSVTAPPSVILPAVMAGRYSPDSLMPIPAMFVSSSAAAAFVFFSLVAAQGILLNVLPVRQFARVSLAIQGALLTSLLCGLPLTFSISSLARSMNQRPEWVRFAPPFWYLGVHQVMMGNREPMAARLGWTGAAGLAGAAGAAVLAYLWSYKRHKVRLLESPSVSPSQARHDGAALAERMIPDSRELAVFAFIAKTLARSRQHRLVLTTFAALAVALIFESFASLALGRGFQGFSARTPGLRQAAISAPLALSMFVLAGFRYLFRLPVELPANWVFRVNEPGNRRIFLAAVERFLLCCAVAPVALIMAPLEVALLGIGMGFAVTILCLLPSLVLMELLLIQFDKIPFTSSYLPGQKPVIETLVRYGVGVTLYVSLLSGLINFCLRTPGAAITLFTVLLAAWWIARKARLDDWKVGLLEFEETAEPVVRTLRIERD